MADATLNDVIARMDRIEALLKDLTAAVRASGVSAAPAKAAAPARAPSVGASKGPPKVKVAPPKRGPGAAAAAVAGAAAKAAPAKPAEDMGASRTMPGDGEQTYDPYADRDDIVLPPADAGILDVMAAAFEALLLPDAEDTWAHLAKLTHSEQLIGPRALDHYKAFTWHKARRGTDKYLVDNDPRSFAIDYTQPAEVTEDVTRVKIFLKKAGGMPAPVAFERDPRDGNAWRVSGMSL